jgi:hypothetical protein
MMWFSHVSLDTVMGLLVTTFVAGFGCGIVFVRRTDRRRWLRIDQFHTAAKAAAGPAETQVVRRLRPGSPRCLPHVVG